jgi:hypothetical protein
MRLRIQLTKHWLLSALLVWMALHAQAQLQQARWMVQASAGSGTDGLLNLSGSVQRIGFNDWGLRIEWRDWRTLAPNTPSDFYSGLCVWGDCEPTNHTYATSVMAVRQFSFFTSWMGWGMDAGPAFLLQERREFIALLEHGMFESNYMQQSHFRIGAGAALRAHLDLFPSDYWGCSFGANCLVQQSARLAFDFAMHFGLVQRRGRKPTR